jgi:hypothetical protein
MVLSQRENGHQGSSSMRVLVGVPGKILTELSRIFLKIISWSSQSLFSECPMSDMYEEKDYKPSQDTFIMVQR